MSQGASASALPAQPSARAILAANLIRLRREKGWSQEALAFECGLHRTFVAHVDRQARNASLDSIERMAVALGVTVSELLSVPPPVRARRRAG
jgi:transcriptional regulator with XRE-family HTH domain